ncbi:MAG: outer membrane beta-barrel protein [Myxococcota bacterium]|nr:outer membrane beta-barrel protein [Myxococcota bacterium]MEC8425189.1 outer membrane beta-barrel protein [Myxococcota bacterium]
MSRPEIPALAILFFGWSANAIAAETPPDAVEQASRADIQAKKKKKKPPPAASRAPKLPGQEVHPAQKIAERRQQARATGRPSAGKAASGRGAGESSSAVRSGRTAQRAKASGNRDRLGQAAAARRPTRQKVGVPERTGVGSAPLRRGAEAPGPRALSGEAVRSRPDLRRVPDDRKRSPARGSAGARSNGSRLGAGGAMGKGTVSRGVGGIGGPARGAAGGPSTAERGPRPQVGGPRTQASDAVRRTPGRTGTPRIVRVKRSKYVPERWAPDYHRGGLDHLPRHHPKYWGSGVFLYNPPSSVHKVTVIEQGGGTQTIEKNADKPLRAVDRAGSFAVGLRGGNYLGRAADGERHSDSGIGIAARFRLVEALGVEVGWSRHRDSWEADATRITDPLSVSGQLFAFPWTRVSPYLSAGYTWTNRSAGPGGGQEQVKGPHAGVGLELAIGESAAIGAEGRYSHYGQLDNISANLQRAGALQGTLGMTFYF